MTKLNKKYRVVVLDENNNKSTDSWIEVETLESLSDAIEYIKENKEEFIDNTLKVENVYVWQE